MTIDYIEKITLQEELKNVKAQLKTVQDENSKLKADIDLYRKADAEKTEKIKRLSEELDAVKYTNLILRTNAATWRLNRDKDNNEDKIKELDARIETLENDRSELVAIHTADVETINKLNIQAHDIKKKVQQLKDIINDLSEEL